MMIALGVSIVLDNLCNFKVEGVVLVGSRICFGRIRFFVVFVSNETFSLAYGGSCTSIILAWRWIMVFP